MKKLLFLLIFFVLTFYLAGDMHAQKMQGSTASAIIEYDLAFPGILPDNPLYKLKVLRDKISSYLISDPQKKIEFYLLQSDKGILASAILIDKGKIKLAQDTLLKAENNLTLITYELKGRFYEKPKPELFQKLKLASLKHQEVISSFIKRVPQENKKTFETVLEFSKSNLETIKRVQNRKYFKSQ